MCNISSTRFHPELEANRFSSAQKAQQEALLPPENGMPTRKKKFAVAILPSASWQNRCVKNVGTAKRKW